MARGIGRTMTAISIRDLAAALGVSKSQVNRRIAARGIQPKKERLPGGGYHRLIDSALLTDEEREAVARAEARRLNPQLPAAVEPAGKKEWQIEAAKSRLAYLSALDALIDTGIPIRKAVGILSADYHAGTLTPELAAHIRKANARAGWGRAVSTGTAFVWRGLRAAADRDGRDRIDALSLAAAKEAPIPAWGDRARKLWCRPHKPSYEDVRRELLPLLAPGEPAPSTKQIRSFIQKLPTLMRNAGRLGPHELRAKHGAYVKRDAKNLLPGDIYIGDGHTLKAWVRHPDTGGRIRAEITAFMDVKTHRWVGFSIDLSESTRSVSDALRHACLFAGPPVKVYYDNGRGANNKAWDDPGLGLCDQLGIIKMNSRPYNSRARGLIERFNRSVFHSLAKGLPLYAGPDMDKEALKAAFKITARELKARGDSELLLTWSQLCDLLRRAQALYNASPQRGLPRITDPATGNLRHLSPDEVWEQAVQAGWQPRPFTVEQARYAFMPKRRRKCDRGVIKYAQNEYFAAPLQHLDGEEVVIGIHVQDARTIEVWNDKGQWICAAVWNGHAREYAPVSQEDRDKARRTQARLGRNDAKRAAILAEARPQLIYSAASSANDATGEPPAIDAVPGAVDRPGDGGEQPIFDDDAVWVTAILAGRVTLDDEQFDYLRGLARQKSWREVRRMAGVDLAALDAFIERTKQQRNAAS